MIRFELRRDKRSYNFKADPNKADSFENNWRNNSIDMLLVIDGDTVIFGAYCQSVANYCFGKMATADTVSYGDTVAEGDFTVKCFVPPRSFHGEIHAIINTRDKDGQIIDHNAMQVTAGGFQNGRWLIHDRYSKKLGKDSNCAWSAGCFILSSMDLKRLNDALRNAGIKAGDEVSGRIVEMEGGLL